ncbi:uncharacterized protein LOC119672469 [Teleopsis dalmanni]|uniref:uncharacterized protein LOC119672469 n=1 Tax=Teleopsis dalmanni TaxID=139649 RepID=UPI0018CD40ED|nr:uncharacterized protein LOC119672469 [Teleopsis dalmanni]
MIKFIINLHLFLIQLILYWKSVTEEFGCDSETSIKSCIVALAFVIGTDRVLLKILFEPSKLFPSSLFYDVCLVIINLFQMPMIFTGNDIFLAIFKNFLMADKESKSWSNIGFQFWTKTNEKEPTYLGYIVACVLLCAGILPIRKIYKSMQRGFGFKQ